MDPELAPQAAVRQPENNAANINSPRAGVDIDALLADLRETYPDYLECFVREGASVATDSAADSPASPNAGSPCKEGPTKTVNKLHSRVINLPTESLKNKRVRSQADAEMTQASSSSSSSQAAGASARPKASSRPSANPAAPAKGSEPLSRPEASPGPSAQPSKAADAAEDIEMSSSATQPNEGFEEVTSRSQKRKLKATKSRTDPPAKVLITAKRTSRSKKPSPSQSVPTAEVGDSAMEDPPSERIPPLYVREKSHWDKLLPMLVLQGITFSHARSTAIGIRVQCPDSLNHRRLSALLRKESIGFHTYALQDERVLRAVIKGLPRELDTGLIKEDLVSQGIPVIEVHRMYQRRSKQPYDMVLVIAELSTEGKRVFDLESVCRLSGLKIEEPMGRGRKMQCHNCQLYGHGARYCYAQPRCVKCLVVGHLTSDCPRRQPTEEPPSCILCGTEGHPANYRGCPKAPKEPKRKGKAAGSQSAPPPPQKFVPAPPPATNAWSKPLNRPKPAQATATSGSASPPRSTPAGAPAAAQTKGPAPTADSADLEKNLKYLNHVIDTVDLDELDEFIEESKVDSMKALMKHAKLIRAVKALRFNV